MALAMPLAFVVGSQPVQAEAGSCTKADQPVTDFQGTFFPYRYYCSTYVDSAVYAKLAGSSNPSDESGYMYQSSQVWVLCQFNGAQNPVINGNTNTWWLYTQGDVALSNAEGFPDAWGYLPATAVSQGGQNEAIPGVPECSGTSPTQTIGTAPDVTQTIGTAPDVTQTIGTVPDVTQTIGTVP
jgi:hypothetical protein